MYNYQTTKQTNRSKKNTDYSKYFESSGEDEYDDEDSESAAVNEEAAKSRADRLANRNKDKF